MNKMYNIIYEKIYIKYSNSAVLNFRDVLFTLTELTVSAYDNKI